MAGPRPCCAPGRRVDRYLANLRECAQGLVDVRWEFVKAVAAALLERTTLRSAEIPPVIRSVPTLD